jgi:hypothetical protein
MGAKVLSGTGPLRPGAAPDRKEPGPVHIELTLQVLVGATALRVFAADIRSLSRRILGAGVRVGAAELAELRSRHAARPAQQPRQGRR